MKFTVEQLKNITKGQILTAGDLPDASFNISTDTRTIQSGDIYLPLRGETFDGEQFINVAIENGAAGYFTTNPEHTPKNNAFAICVPDTKIAYLQIANYYKKCVNPVTIAITGSSGKTTTKEITSAIFSANRKTHKTHLNHNNEIGLCQTILSMPQDTAVLIVEMGMRGLGEIDLLAKYVEPNYAMITNIGTAHIGRLGSRENIAKAKCEIVNYMGRDGVLVTHYDELYKSALKDFKGQHIVINYDDYEKLSMTQTCSEFKYRNHKYTLYACGDHNVADALLAIETALRCGLSPEEIQSGLNTYKQIEKRFEETDINGIKIINDSYNANPDSMKAAIKTFIELFNGNKVLVIADMKELGTDEVKYHAEIGEFLNQYDNIKVITVGELAKNITAATKHISKNFSNNREVAQELKKLPAGSVVFMKGSRSMKLEEIIDEMAK